MIALVIFALVLFFAPASAYTTYGKALRDELRSKYYKHTNLGYSGIRVEMYGVCFNAPGRNSVFGIYTGDELAYKYDSTNTSQNGDLNCEHLVPQSFFNKKDPMRADGHHLRPANAKANNARSNYPFAEVEPDKCIKWFIRDVIETTTPEVNIRDQYSCLSSDKMFYPRKVARGNVARAVAYFFTMYPEYMSQYERTIVSPEIMVKWHEENPVTSEEISQHDCIVEVQEGGGNPYIFSDPTLMRRAYCDMLKEGCDKYY